MSGPLQRTAIELYRDCLRLVRHVAPGHSPKALALRQTVRSQFRANRSLTDETQIEAAKASAVRALSNYMLFQSANSDPRLQKAMRKKETGAADRGRQDESDIDGERRQR